MGTVKPSWRGSFWYCLIIILFASVSVDSASAGKIRRLRAENDTLRKSLLEAQRQLEDIPRLRAELRRNYERLDLEQRAHMENLRSLQSDMLRYVGISSGSLAVAFLIALWLVQRRYTRERKSPDDWMPNNAGRNPAPPYSTNTTEPREAIGTMKGNGREDPEEKSGNGISPAPRRKPQADKHADDTALAGHVTAYAKPPGSHPLVFWFTAAGNDTAFVHEIVELLRRRGIDSVKIGAITREVVRDIEQGAYTLLLCAYEPLSEQGISIDKNLQGVINALNFAETFTPLIIYVNTREHELSSWDQHMINGYDFATVTTSRLSFVNQIILSLQTLHQPQQAR